MAHVRLDPARNLDRALEVDAGVDAHAPEHVDEVLGRDVAGRRRRERAAAEAAEARVQHARTRSHGSVGVRQPSVAGVVEVAAQGDAGHGFGDAPEDLGHLPRHADPDRVGNRDLEGRRLRELARNVDHALHGNLALERAAEGGRDRDLRADPGGARGRRDLAPGADGVRARHALVAAVELVGREDDHADLAAAGRGGAVEPGAVQHQADVGDVVAARERLQDRLRVRHLRDAARAHEARDLDAADAGLDRAPDELDLHAGRHARRLVLQAVARPDLDDLDAATLRHVRDSITHRAAAISRRGPRFPAPDPAQPTRLDQRSATPRVLLFAAAAAANAFFASADFLLFASEMPSTILTSSARLRLPSATARCAASAAFG